jgi:hypothetical protein
MLIVINLLNCYIPVIKKYKNMKNAFKLLHVGISLSLLGTVLAAFSAVSYSMSDNLVSLIVLFAGIILFIIGRLPSAKAKKRGA